MCRVCLEIGKPCGEAEHGMMRVRVGQVAQKGVMMTLEQDGLE